MLSFIPVTPSPPWCCFNKSFVLFVVVEAFSANFGISCLPFLFNINVVIRYPITLDEFVVNIPGGKRKYTYSCKKGGGKNMKESAPSKDDKGHKRHSCPNLLISPHYEAASWVRVILTINK